jgi:hypothetical protein
LLPYAHLDGREARVSFCFVSWHVDLPYLPNDVVWFRELESSVCYFSMGGGFAHDEAVLFASICRALAQAYRAHKGLTRAEPQEEILATELTAVSLGFGAILLQGLQPHQINHQKWKGRASEELPCPEYAFLLAVQVIGRGMDRAARQSLAGLLGAQQARCFLAACSALAPEAAQLRERLGLPRRRSWQAGDSLVELPTPKVVCRPLPEPMEPADDTAPAPVRAAPEPVYIVRLPPRREGPIALFGGLIGLLCLKDGAYLLALFMLLPSLLIGVQVLRKKPDRPGVCSNRRCITPMAADETLCPGCGGRVLGTVDRADGRFSFLES